ncbi:ImmA/IrrE family metallo-endopeptidase [Ruminococcus sp.]|uniref:ImmA/IrrE family metallo-endopeptidase n=1 Tax=Ruminococcus sp. TaxID=41978 RepID=UPI0025E98EB3|nr:ImmA/IrrE family metallo-endopeptidase [Ruminococcus sp.]
MAQYDSLKDYIRLNHLDTIVEGVNDYIRTSSNVKLRINDLKILTQGKIVFMPSDIIVQSEITFSPFDILTFILGISCEESHEDNNSVGVYYYNVMLRGNMSNRFSDLCVLAVEECTQESLISETVTSMFGLPNIAVDNLEEEADRVRKRLYTSVKRIEEHRYRFNPVLIKEKYKKSDNMHMWPAELPEECLGQIRFEASSATIYDINDPYTPHPNYPIPANTILLNVKYYRNEIDCDDIITAAHELVHWEIHRDYMRLLQFLDDRYKVMECKTVPIPLDNNMSLKEKARWYAEWQANELAIRVAMPKHLVEEAIEEYNNDESVHNSTDVPFSGPYYQNMIYKLAWDFNVPKEIMKMRFRQLGYDFADGIFVTVDNCNYQPFTFAQGTLKENETFVIDRVNYERLLRENSDFKKLISSGRYIYLGYVVCMFDTKYIDIVCDSDCVDFVLSSYARQHADECCLKFCLHNNCTESRNALLYDHVFLYREPYSEESEYYFDKNDNNDNMRLSQLMLDKIQDEIDEKGQCERDDALIYEMKKEGVDTFSKALTYIMDKANNPRITKNHIAEVLGCSEKTVQNYRHRDVPDTVENVMLICLACKTGPKVSEFLINKAVGGIPDIGKKKTAYKFLLKYTGTSLDYWNMILAKFELPPIKRYDQ